MPGWIKVQYRTFVTKQCPSRKTSCYPYSLYFVSIFPAFFPLSISVVTFIFNATKDRMSRHTCALSTPQKKSRNNLLLTKSLHFTYTRFMLSLWPLHTALLLRRSGIHINVNIARQFSNLFSPGPCTCPSWSECALLCADQGFLLAWWLFVQENIVQHPFFDIMIIVCYSLAFCCFVPFVSPSCPPLSPLSLLGHPILSVLSRFCALCP